MRISAAIVFIMGSIISFNVSAGSCHFTSTINGDSGSPPDIQAANSSYCYNHAHQMMQALADGAACAKVGPGVQSVTFSVNYVASNTNMNQAPSHTFGPQTLHCHEPIHHTKPDRPHHPPTSPIQNHPTEPVPHSGPAPAPAVCCLPESIPVCASINALTGLTMQQKADKCKSAIPEGCSWNTDPASGCN